jgi:hypothetical protein
MTIEVPISIGNIIRNAVVFDPKNWRRGHMDENALLHDVERLFELLDERRIDYVLVGDITILQYVEGRNTHVSETDLGTLKEIVAEIQQRIERFRRGFTARE